MVVNYGSPCFWGRFPGFFKVVNCDFFLPTLFTTYVLFGWWSILFFPQTYSLPMYFLVGSELCFFFQTYSPPMQCLDGQEL